MGLHLEDTKTDKKAQLISESLVSGFGRPAENGPFARPGTPTFLHLCAPYNICNINIYIYIYICIYIGLFNIFRTSTGFCKRCRESECDATSLYFFKMGLSKQLQGVFLAPQPPNPGLWTSTCSDRFMPRDAPVKGLVQCRWVQSPSAAFHEMPQFNVSFGRDRPRQYFPCCTGSLLWTWWVAWQV